MKNLFISTTLGFILLGLFIPTQTFAQQFDVSGASNLQMLPFPENPLPNSFTRIELRDYSTDLSKATIVWTRDGKVVARGTGVTQYSYTTGKRGVASTIVATVTASDIGTISSSLTINPSDVDLVWEADTTVPPLYRGKALPSSESTVKVVAFPHLVSRGKELSPDTLSYTWKVDDKVQQQQSGHAKNVLVYRKSLLKAENIVSVTVSSLDNAIGTEKEIIVPEIEPEVHFYEESPLEGTIYDTSLDVGGVMTGSEAIIRAEPFYFSTTDMNTTNSTIRWEVNGSTAPFSKESPLLVTIRASKDFSGSTSVSFTIENKLKLLQSKSGAALFELKKR